MFIAPLTDICLITPLLASPETCQDNLVLPSFNDSMFLSASSNKALPTSDVGLVTQLFANGENLGAGQSSVSDVNANGRWYYDDSNDAVYYYNDTTNPHALLIESGDDWDTLRTRYISTALPSMCLEYFTLVAPFAKSSF